MCAKPRCCEQLALQQPTVLLAVTPKNQQLAQQALDPYELIENSRNWLENVGDERYFC